MAVTTSATTKTAYEFGMQYVNVGMKLVQLEENNITDDMSRAFFVSLYTMLNSEFPLRVCLC